MTGEGHNQRLVELLGPLLALEGAARYRFVDQICVDEPWLRTDLEALIDEAEEIDDDFLAPQPARVIAAGEFHDASASTPLPRLDRLGAYRIVHHLGQGGMGTVYLGLQEEPIRRQVAIKVIDGIESRGRKKRFAAECQALARLNHPNIASLYEVGSTEDQRSFVVMELVEGTAITHWCDEHRLALRDRIKLFQGACAGIRHANERGVLHRDLKPANVLVTEVDGRPLAKVIDFGIARSLDDHPLVDTGTPTASHQLLGSPAYMSPEGANGRHDLDTRSDVYSLGLLLYELLAGVTPFDADSENLLSLLGRLGREERPKLTERIAGLAASRRDELADLRGLSARSWQEALRGDLEAIVRKAIAVDREHRYDSPGELAADIDRYLNHRPISARPPRMSDRVFKFSQRHKPVVTLAAVVLLVLSVGIATLTTSAVRARRTDEKARDGFLRAEQVLGGSLAAAGVAESQASAETASEETLAAGKGLREDALRYYQGFIKDFSGNQALRSELVQAHLQASRLHTVLGTPGESLAALENAVDLLDDLVDEDPEASEVRYRLADAKHQVAWRHFETGDPHKAMIMDLQAIDLQEELVRDFPQEPRYRRLLAQSLADHSEAQALVGQSAAAAKSARRALVLLNELRNETDEPDRQLEESAATEAKLVAIIETAESLEIATAWPPESL